MTVKSSGRIIDNIISCITARRDQINLAVVRRNRIIEDRIKEFSLYVHTNGQFSLETGKANELDDLKC